MADYKVNLSAGTQTEIGAVGNYYRILEASGDVWIGIDGGPLQKRAAGIGEEVLEGFSRLTLYSDIDQAVLLSVTRGRIDDGRLSVTAPVKQDVGDSLASFPDVSLNPVSATLIVAANPARREVLISNLELNAETIRIGDANAAASRGIELSPGSTIVLTTTAAIYGYNPGTTAQPVGVLEVAD